MAPPLYIALLLWPLLLSWSLQTPPSSAAAAGDTLRAGQALAAGAKLVSGNGKFALGFFRPTSTSKSGKNATSPYWYLGVWFNAMPICTPVWIANRDTPITAPNLNLTQLKISPDGTTLVLSLMNSNATSEHIIWSSPSPHPISRTDPNTSLNTSAVLLDTGNLQLVIESQSNVTSSLWESFDYPTDIVLPTAKFGWNKVTGLIRQGISKKSLIDPGLGSYSLELDASGLVLQHRNPSVVYWSWSAQKQVLSIIKLINMILDMDPRTTGLLKPVYVNNNEEEYYAFTLLNESSYAFMSLGISGQIMINVWSHDHQSWQIVYANPLDPCTPSATCGPFTVCSATAQPFCSCMEGFSQKSPQEWDLDDRSGGCVRNTPLQCTSSKKNTVNSTDAFRPVARVSLPYGPQSIGNATTDSKCAEACLSSCTCTAYTYNSSGCSVWHGELLSVNLNDGIEISSQDVLYIRLAAKDLPTLTKNRRKPTVVVVATSIMSFGLLMLMLLLVVWRNKFNWCGASSHETQGSGGIIAFRYAALGHATKNFSEQLGAGGFGSVFKGVLSDLTTIAVKRLDGARQGEKQFRAEVSSLGSIQHINLVKLIGFCCDGDKRLLVYEHMSNGSLDGHLFESSTIMNWETRYQVAIGVARGLSYLHQSCHKCIIHCDIKPENILLDASFVPKIADFGMAAIVGRDFSRVLTTFRGTVGYLAPEWLSGVAITPKVDVYSFGMVLLEMISGRRNAPEIHSGSNYHVEYFPVRAIRMLHEGDVQSLMDPQLHGNFNLEEAERVCKVAYWCIQDNEHNRPTMVDVVQILEGLQEVGMPPMPRLLAAITECSSFFNVTSLHTS
ncbi:hypothetical protein ACP4OV_009706 [Aristida adscensionis]